MNRKKLFQTALISSPIMAAFETSPIYFLVGSQASFKFWDVLLIFTLLSLVIWGVNILLFSFKETKMPGRTWKRYILSYILTIMLVAIIMWLINLFFTFFERPEDSPSVLFPIINILALNTIILILSDAIILRSKKEQTEVELANLKILHLEAEQQQLIHQMQPHFLFNSLSTLKSLIKNDAELAEEYLVKLADFLRFTISAQENRIIPLLDELQFTGDYIDMQQIRFSGSLYSEISIPEEKKQEYKIPVYALQTLVENAIKHNAFTEEYPLKLSITYHKGSLIVSNNKIPKSPNNNRIGVGLENLDKRYLLFGGEKTIIEETPQTFSVTIKLIKNNVC
jgi:two-component system LytT family sensor kinase